MSYTPDPNPGSHADIHRRHPLSAPGKYFVDDQCLDCDLCRETAPTVIRRDDSRGWSYVARQPETAEEIAQVKECVAACPCEAIGDTGDRHDWEKLPPVRWDEPVEGATEPAKECSHCRPKKPWWRFW